MASRELPISQPTSGPFDSLCKELIWRDCTRKGILHKCCRIPAERRQDFLKGEAQRSQTYFYALRVKNQAKASQLTSPSASKFDLLVLAKSLMP